MIHCRASTAALILTNFHYTSIEFLTRWKYTLVEENAAGVFWVGFFFFLSLRSWCSAELWLTLDTSLPFLLLKGQHFLCLGQCLDALCKSHFKVDNLGKGNHIFFCPCIYDDYVVPFSSSCADATSSALVCGSSQSVCSKHATQHQVSQVHHLLVFLPHSSAIGTWKDEGSVWLGMIKCQAILVQIRSGFDTRVQLWGKLERIIFPLLCAKCTQVENNYRNAVNNLIENDRACTFPEGLVWIYFFLCMWNVLKHSIPDISIKKIDQFSNILNIHIFPIFFAAESN